MLSTVCCNVDNVSNKIFRVAVDTIMNGCHFPNGISLSEFSFFKPLHLLIS